MFAISMEENKNLDQLSFLKKMIEEIALLLPIQNPIPFFVHNNPIQFWESLPFIEGMAFATLTYENVEFKCNRSKLRNLEDLALPVIMSYVDQGLNQWEQTYEDSLWSWFCRFTLTSCSIKNSSLPRLKEKIETVRSKEPDEIILQILLARKIPIKKWKDFIQHLVMHFKGWSGMIFLLERNKSLYPIEAKNIALIDWIAILVIIADQLEIDAEITHHESLDRRENQIKENLKRINKSSFSFYERMILQFSKHLNSLKNPTSPSSTYEVQALFCIDDREESVRRHLEKAYPQCQTFSTVGFFGIPFKLKPHKNVVFYPQCPPVIKPSKQAYEINEAHSKAYTFIQNTLDSLNSARFRSYEPLLALIAPFIYPLALLTRSISPSLYMRLRNVDKFNSKTTESKIKFEEHEEFSLDEKSKIVLDILKSSGLSEKLSPLVVVIGHGSTTTNNPFNKSYGCGACSGQSGYPNARVFCSYANDPNVRTQLAEKQLIIPDTTQFLAGYHDTCSDEIYFSKDTILNPENQNRLEEFKKSFAQALKINAKERFKIFKVPPLENPQNRAHNWSEPRPEFGHSKMSMSIFGPRWLTENFDLGRRAFLISYDPKIDHQGDLLEYVINNSLPVCANINLDYFTSTAFPKAFGAGSKLPLNIASGIGLMTGSKSDLRIGLARQMVDQHNPMRLLCFVYSKKEPLEKVISKSQRLKNLIMNEWIHLVRIDPLTLNLHPMTEEIKNVFETP